MPYIIKDALGVNQTVPDFNPNGRTGAASSSPVVLSTEDAAAVTTGNASLSSIDGKLASLGQKNMAGSAPVVIASDQSALNVGVNAGTNNIGNVGGKTVAVTVTPTVTTANAYGTNFVVGGLLTFANAFTSKGSGIIQSVTVTSRRVQTQGFTLFLFAGNPSNTTWTDAAVANINAADISIARGPINLSPASSNSSNALGTMTVATATGLGLAMSPGATTLYAVLLSNAALTNNFTSTSDITVTVTVLQDI